MPKHGTLRGGGRYRQRLFAGQRADIKSSPLQSGRYCAGMELPFLTLAKSGAQHERRPKAKEPGDAKIIQLAKDMFKRANEREMDTRLEALDDLRFARLGEQWPTAIKRQREIDGRACLTINKMPSFIRQVANDARQNKPSIAVNPADDRADPETVEIINGLVLQYPGCQ